MAKMVLEMQHITKTFPGVKALDDVSLQAYERGDPFYCRRERCREKHTDENPKWFLFLRQLCR